MRILDPVDAGAYGLPPVRHNARLPGLRQVQVAGSNPSLQILPRTGNLLLLMGSSIQAGDFTASGGGATWSRVGRVSLTGGNGGAQLETQLWVGKVGSSPSQSISAAWVNVTVSWVFEIDCVGFAGRVAASATASANAGPMTLPTLSGLGLAESNKTVLYVYTFGSRGTLSLTYSRPTSLPLWQVSEVQSTDPKTGIGIGYYAPGISMPGVAWSAGNNLQGAIGGIIV